MSPLFHCLSAIKRCSAFSASYVVENFGGATVLPAEISIPDGMNRDLASSGYPPAPPLLPATRAWSVYWRPCWCGLAIAELVSAIATLELGANNFRNLLRNILEQLNAPQDHHHADNCRKCIFLTERAFQRASRTPAEYECRFFRAALSGSELDLLCVNSEPHAAGEL